MALIILDAGHGGNNPGAVYNGRQEKDDALALVLAVGAILEANDVDVYYTRTTDVYETPFQKAQEANLTDADYFVSVHRNSSPMPNQYNGVESLVYNRYGRAAAMAARAPAANQMLTRWKGHAASTIKSTAIMASQIIAAQFIEKPPSILIGFEYILAEKVPAVN